MFGNRQKEGEFAAWQESVVCGGGGGWVTETLPKGHTGDMAHQVKGQGRNSLTGPGSFKQTRCPFN